ncbi:alpha-galactosidase A [Aspergillus eucalypticola CBS 122712]|uniref:Alpha-galactosidase A n=1 Tax=Aspergillus eucalypticola (strain CBS 122712 / IBT 29274) TaxID=1448314 RepID=A0A317UWH8_ASPEC|nr:alpha-galactosidase A [Aspergillus eucalypticola CBS 122712]PWY65769.1 alpha-galactosidase A [Aspergillus eucalypticola CBS 122712]
MDVSSKDDSDYRILLQNKIRYLTIRPGTFDRSTLSTPLSSLPNLPGDHTWNCALINRDPSNHQITIELQNRNLTGITDIWHSLQIDCLQLRRIRQLTATTFEATHCRTTSESLSTTILEENTTIIAKIARFEWEIPLLSRETSIYKQLQGISDLAPRFLGHVHEHGRVIRIILERVEGREAGIEDLVGCQAVLKRLHDLGFVHGDVNRYNFVVRGDGTVSLIDFESSWQDKAATALMRAEMESLGEQLVERTGRGAGFAPGGNRIE